MDRDRFPTTPSREPNPLRPYYIPPSIGTSSASASASASQAHAQAPHAAKGTPPRSGATLGSSARDLFEIDIDIKSTTSEAWQQTRSLFDTLAWRYTSVLLAQPFDVSKTILQVALPPSSATAATPQKRRSRASSRQRGSGSGSVRGRGQDRHYEDETDGSCDSDRSDDIPDYFSSAAPRSRSPRKRRRTPPSQNASPSPTPRPRNRREQDDGHDYKIVNKKPASIMHAISALYTTSGAVGLWRASNTTFLYSILLRTTDSFIRSLLLAILGLPDLPGPDHGGLAPGLTSGGAGFSGIDLSDSPNAVGSLIVVGLASCITGLLLAPLDLVRTRLIVTPVSHPPRGLISNLKRLPSLVASSDLWLPTALFHSVPNIFSAASPLILRRQMRLAPETTPGLWSLAAFTTSLSELFIRLPLETVVRRAQVTAIKKAQSDVPLVVDPAPYSGVWTTVYGIMYSEGETTTKGANGTLRTRRGQGAAGLVRGWRVGFWGLVGVWGAGALGPGDVKSGGQF